MTTTTRPDVGYRGLYVAAFAAWFLLTVIGLGYAVRHSIAAVEEAFNRGAESLVAELRDKLKANEAVIAGFSSFLSAVEANDRASVQHYASLMLASYPHIYMLEIVREVRDEDRQKFERYLRKSWGGSFNIRSFGYDGSRSWSTAPEKPVYQPIVFIWPETEEARPVVGLDVDSVPHLREALLEARMRRVAISSNPFKLVEGDDAYVMFRHTDRSASRSPARPEYGFAGPLTALLVMKARALLPSAPAPLTSHRLQVVRAGKFLAPALYDVPAATPPGSFEAALLPRLRLQTADFGTSQPMQLALERQIRFTDLNGVGLTSASLFSLVSLVLIVAYLRGHSRNIAYALALERQAEYLALHDSLTRLPNRHLLEDRVHQALATWRRRGVGFALLFLDLDRFKEINDNYGHATGDQLLCGLSTRLAEAVRESDTVARYGGDEFVILISSVANDDDVVTVSGKILNSVAQPFELDDVTISITASLGISRCPRDGQDFPSLLKRADKAMYGVKRGRVAVESALRIDSQGSDG
jgi:diguanylate cyclase (GGDEF)-like protein